MVARGTAPASGGFPALADGLAAARALGLDRAPGRGPGAGGPCSQLL